MARFKEGDWVRATANWIDIKVGDVCRVDCIADDGFFVLEYRVGEHTYYMTANEIEPWAPRVGERVRALVDECDVDAGSTYEVVSLADDGNCSIHDNAGDSHYMFASQVEPTTDKHVAEPKFKVGDAIRHKGLGYVGTVKEIVDADTVKTHWTKEGWGGVDPIEDIELVTTTPLKIEAGKFYMTRDGRKVGPMRAAGGIYAERWKWACDQLTSPVDENGKYSCFDRDSPSDIIAEATAAVTPPTTAQLGTTIVCLIRDGKPLPATEPYVHDDQDSANAEAERLAELHKGDTFGVYELVSTVRENKPTYDHEWQRLAAEGQKVGAVVALRRVSGLGIKAAKDAVEDWMLAA